MLERVEGHSPCLPSSVVAKSVCHETVRSFVKGHSQDNRYNPGAHLIGCHRFAFFYFSLACKERVELRPHSSPFQPIARGPPPIPSPPPNPRAGEREIGPATRNTPHLPSRAPVPLTARSHPPCSPP